jgi:hypothetical protein
VINVNKVIDWVNKLETDEIIHKIVGSNVDIDKIIQQLLESRKSYGLKIQEIVKRLERMSK